MSSYQPLADHLAARETDVWDAGFDEVERILGRPLPQSAYRYNAWWANQTGKGHSQTHGWRSVGWKTAKLDLESRQVRFERDERPYLKVQKAPLPDTIDGLVEQAMLISGVEDREAVIKSALREYIDNEAVRGLIAMGGSQPGFQAGPRKRPWG